MPYSSSDGQVGGSIDESSLAAASCASVTTATSVSRSISSSCGNHDGLVIAHPANTSCCALSIARNTIAIIHVVCTEEEASVVYVEEREKHTPWSVRNLVINYFHTLPADSWGGVNNPHTLDIIMAP